MSLSRIVIITAILLSVSVTRSLGKFTLKGRCIGEQKVKTLDLYKYNSIFDSKFVTKIAVVADTFQLVGNEIAEPDAYFLRDADDDTRAYLFFWDGDLEIELNLDSFPKSIAKNSPLTTERDKYERTILTNFIGPVKEIEKALELEKNRKPIDKAKVDSLQLSLNKATDAGKRGLGNFRKEYVKGNTTSLFSLYLLTIYLIDQPDKDSKELFTLLAENLKMHSRSSIFYNLR